VNILVSLLVTVVGCAIAVSLYNWVKAEIDERHWRRMLEDELKFGDNTPLYRLTRMAKDGDE
jgi:hypothetical protein